MVSGVGHVRVGEVDKECTRRLYMLMPKGLGFDVVLFGLVYWCDLKNTNLKLCGRERQAGEFIDLHRLNSRTDSCELNSC